MHEADVSTEQSTAQKDAWVSHPHEQSRGATDLEAPAGEGAQAPHGQGPPETAALTDVDQRLPKSRRIRKRAEYLRLQRRGRRRAGRCFVIITERRARGPSRLGITASRRVGGAVVRNRIKRLVREVFRRHQQKLTPAQDVLVLARTGAAEATYADVRQELCEMLRIQADDRAD
jgi:ribonuclease P protein component